MGQIPSHYSDDGEEKFHQQISQYNESQLQLIYQYFREDFIKIVQAMKAEDLLERLALRKILSQEMYLQMRSDLGAVTFSIKLVEDILEGGRETIIGFLEILYKLQEEYWLYNFTVIHEELKYYGDTFLQRLSLDQDGHPLNTELKELQEHHKHHLLEAEHPTEKETKDDQHLISECYMPLVATTIRPFQRQGQNRFLETGAKHGEYVQTTQNYAEHISPKGLFRWSHKLKCAPHVVVLSGVAGVGKTTMLQKFLCDWAKGKFYQRFAFVFYFQFRDLNKLEDVSLQSMILQQYPHLEGGIIEILKGPERLLFIFDGFDEYVEKLYFKTGQTCCDPKQAESVGTIVVSLVRQSLLKGCSILLASRPERLAVTDMSGFRRVMEIIGFLPKERRLYYERFFKSKELSDQAFNFVEENGVLFTFSYLPSFCWIVCTVMSTFFEAQQTTKDPLQPKTLTQLFVAFCADILSNHASDEFGDVLTSIGELAEHGILNHITRFEKQALLKFNVDMTSKIFPSFLKKSSDDFSFRYPMIQEFLAALVHYIHYSPEKLQNSLSEARSCKDNRGQIFLCFLCGLSDLSTRSILEPFLGELSSNAAQDVLAWHQKLLNKMIVSDHFKEDKKQQLYVFFRLFETQNKDFVFECLGQCKRFKFSQFALTPLDCHVLAFILESCRENEELTLNDPAITSRSMTRLGPALHTLHFFCIGDVRDLGDAGVPPICTALTHPDCKIQALWLAMNGFTHLSCSYLAPALIKNQSLRTLSLSYNRLEGPHFSDLMDALSDPSCKWEELCLDNMRLTEKSCPALISGLKGNRSLKKLELSFNELAGPHLDDLISALSSPTCKIQQLRMSAINLTDEQVPSLVPLCNNTHLTYLELSHNDYLTDACVDALKELIMKSPSLKHLSIFLYHRLSDESARVLSQLKTQKPGFDVGC